jgi:hypothetical protein
LWCYGLRKRCSNGYWGQMPHRLQHCNQFCPGNCQRIRL